MGARMEYRYGRIGGQLVCGAVLPPQAVPAQPLAADEDCCFLFSGATAARRECFAVSDIRQLAMPKEDYTWLDASSLADVPAALAADAYLAGRIAARRLRAVDLMHPRWPELLASPGMPARRRVHVLALGDVGANLLIGLRLLGGDCIREIGIYDLDAARCARWEFELNQIVMPGGSPALPPVRILSAEQLFACDVFVFCASAGVPPPGSGEMDVRMAQYAANRRIIAAYARAARAARFRGLFAVVSDPVDLLCQAAWSESNRDETGRFDGEGLFCCQIRGYGLGVMYARARYYAEQDARFATFITEGAVYGPHGADLVVANSLMDYDDLLSRQLTQQVVKANLQMRALGFKPYVAPALSSGALSLLATLRGDWYHGAARLGDIFFGARLRETAAGPETELKPLPPLLLDRLGQAAQALRQQQGAKLAAKGEGCCDER